MNTTDGLIEIISDLRRINMERMECYEGTLNREQFLQVELTEMINNKLRECRRNIEALTKLSLSFGVEFGRFGLIPGKIFLAWTEARKDWVGNFRKSVLNECSYGEAAVLEAYRTALVSDALNHCETRRILMDQKFLVQIFTEQVSRYSDFQALSLQPLMYVNY